MKDAVYKKPNTAKSIAVPMLRKIGERLSSDERAPYERVEHDDVFDMAQPTNPNLQALLRTDENDPT